VKVEEAEKIILDERCDYGTESISFDNCQGRVLAEDIYADRDMPPFNRVTMDGIAINYEAWENGIRTFRIKATQSAGVAPIDINSLDECVEIMTGAVLPGTTNTIIAYEETDIQNGVARINSENVLPNQSIHFKGKDKKKGDVLVRANQFITPAIVAVAASTGKVQLLVKKLPKAIIISTGDELTEVNETPADFQIRRSNNYAIQAILKDYAMHADMLHLPDDPDITARELERCLREYDVILLSGGVSMGKFDYVPAALEKLQVEKLFHKVRQRPGKPFWFGKGTRGALVFAFPGNPVSTFMCVQRYFLPWLKTSLQVGVNTSYAILSTDFTFQPALQYFLQVRLHISDQGQLMATPMEGNGSGDFANLPDADAFMELPLGRNHFSKGEAFRIWPFKQIM